MMDFFPWRASSKVNNIQMRKVFGKPLLHLRDPKIGIGSVCEALSNTQTAS